VIVRSAPAIPDTAVAQAPAPVENHRFSQAPATVSQAAGPTAVVGEAEHSSADAPATRTERASIRRYSGNVGHHSRPAWSLLKTSPAKYDVNR
jgi:hypothetical protein